jgi:methionine-rich copper-binding protein CopC
VEQQETITERVERELSAFMSLLRRRWALAISIAVCMSIFGLWQLGVLPKSKPAEEKSAAAAVLQVALTYQELFKENQRLNVELNDAKASAQETEILKLQTQIEHVEQELQNAHRDLNDKARNLANASNAETNVVHESANPVGWCTPDITSITGNVTITCPGLDPKVIGALNKQLANAQKK